MRRTLLTGGVLATAAALLADHGGHLGLETTRAALLGLTLGAVLGLVHDVTPTARTVGFGLGLGIGWIGYAVRAGVLPDIPMGRAIAAFGIIAAATLITVVTGGRIALWVPLLGIAGMAGGYETTFNTTPTAFVSESVTALTSVLLAAAVGFLVTQAVAATDPAEPDHHELARSTAELEEEIWLPGQRTADDSRVEQEA